MVGIKEKLFALKSKADPLADVVFFSSLHCSRKITVNIKVMTKSTIGV